MLWMISVIVILLFSVFLYFYFAILKTQFFIIDKSALLDHRVIEILKRIPVDIKLLLPQITLDSMQKKANSKNIVEAEIAKKGLENFKTLKNLENVKIKIFKDKNTEKTQTDIILKIAKKYNCKILTTNFELYMKAKVERIKILNLDDMSEIFKKNWILGDIITIYITAKERQEGVSYLYDGTKIIVLNAGEYVDKKVVCTVFKINKDMSENKVFAKFLRVSDN